MIIAFKGGNMFIADFYIDDRAIGCPVYYNAEGSRCADWDKIKKDLKELKVI